MHIEPFILETCLFDSTSCFIVETYYEALLYIGWAHQKHRRCFRALLLHGANSYGYYQRCCLFHIGSTCSKYRTESSLSCCFVQARHGLVFILRLLANIASFPISASHNRSKSSQTRQRFSRLSAIYTTAWKGRAVHPVTVLGLCTVSIAIQYFLPCFNLHLSSDITTIMNDAKDLETINIMAATLEIFVKALC